MCELTTPLIEVFKASDVLFHTLQDWLGPDLFQNGQNIKADVQRVGYSSFLLAILKLVLDKEEQSYCFVGPPSTANPAEWVCCLSPCVSFKHSQSMNLSTFCFGELVRSGFQGNARQTKKTELAYRRVHDRRRKTFVGKKFLSVKEAAFIALSLIPARLLPLFIKTSLVELLPANAKGNVDNLFICPAHFGFLNEGQPDKTDHRTLREFNFHGFMTQLCFEPFQFAFLEDLNVQKVRYKSGPKVLPQETLDLHSFLLTERQRNGGECYQNTEHDSFHFEIAEDNIRGMFGVTTSTKIVQDRTGRILALDQNVRVEPERVIKENRRIRVQNQYEKELQNELERRLSVFVARITEAENACKLSCGSSLVKMTSHARLTWCFEWMHQRAKKEGTEFSGCSEEETAVSNTDAIKDMEEESEKSSSEDDEDEFEEEDDVARDADFQLAGPSWRETSTRVRRSARSRSGSVLSEGSRGSNKSDYPHEVIDLGQSSTPEASILTCAIDPKELELPDQGGDPDLINSQIQFDANRVQEANVQTAYAILTATPPHTR